MPRRLPCRSTGPRRGVGDSASRASRSGRATAFHGRPGWSSDSTTPRRRHQGATAMREWQPIETAPLDVEIETKIDDVFGARNETRLVGYRRGPDTRIMWFLPDR